MKIGEASIANIQQNSSTMNQTTLDAKTQSFQNQIASAQTQLQKLSADRNMSSEEKAKKRQEIQKQIAELNNMLREHKMQMRREKQQKMAEEAARNEEQQKKQQSSQSQNTSSNAVTVEEKPKTSDTSKTPNTSDTSQTSNSADTSQTSDASQTSEKSDTSGMSSNSLKSLVAADSAVNKVKTQESVAKDLKSRIRVLQGEIEQATQNGGYVDAKKDELQSLENKVEKISGAKMNILSNAMQEINQMSDYENKKDIKSGYSSNGTVKEPADLPSKDFTTKKQVDMYTKGKMFSNVNIYF